MTPKKILFFSIQFVISVILFMILILADSEWLFLNESVILQFILFAVSQILFLFSSEPWPFFGRIKKVLSVILFTAFTIAALYIIYSIIFVPFGMYLYWITLIQDGSQGGAITGLFVWCQIFFLGLFAGLSYHKKIVESLMGILVSQCFMFAVIFHHAFLIVTIVFLIALTLIYLVVIKRRTRSRPGAYRYHFIHILLVLGLSYVVSLSSPLYQGWLSRLSLLPQVRNFLTRDFPVSPVISTIGETRNNTSESTMGVSNFSNSPVFMISGKKNHAFYIRISAYGTYADNTWYNDYDRMKPIDTALVSFNREIAHPDLKITLLADYYIQIPHTLKATEINLSAGKPRNLEYASFDYGFKLDLPLTGNNEIDILEASPKSSSIPDLSKEERELYLEIPPKIRKRLLSLPGFTNMESLNDRDKMNAILDFFGDHFWYTLNPGPLKKETDIVPGFLFETKAGYCQHFSSAFVLLARLYGMPSRYVQGYYGIIPGNKDSALITGMSSHAWAEVWIPGEGWQTVETIAPVLLNRPEQEHLIASIRDEATREQLNSLLQMHTVAPKNSGEFDFRYLIPVLLAVLAAGLTGAKLVGGKRKKSREHKSPGQLKAGKIFRALVKRTGKQGIPGPDILGWKEWACSFGRHLKLDEPEIRLLAGTAFVCFYGCRDISPEEILMLQAVKNKKGVTIYSR